MHVRMPIDSTARCCIVVATVLCACGEPSEPGMPVRLANGASDTVVLNSRYPQTLSVLALDAAGHTIQGASILYTRVGGDTGPLTPTGAVECTRAEEQTT